MSSRLCAPLPTAELERRWAATRSAMKAAGIDALVLQSSEDFMGGYVRWFTDQPAVMAYPRTVIFPREGLMTTCDVGGFGEQRQSDGTNPNERGIGRRVFTPSFNGAVDYTGRYDAELVAAEIRKNGWRTVGLVCPNGMYHGLVAGLEQGLKGVELVNATDLVDAIKAIKSPEEQRWIRATATMQDGVMAKVMEHVKPGMKEFELAAFAQYQAQLGGSEQGIFLCCSAPGKVAPFQYRYQQSRTFEKGDVVTLLAEHNGAGGFYTELCRSFVLGRASAELKDALDANVAAQQYTLSLLKPGADCAEVFAKHNDWMRSHGEPEEKRIHCHGQGYEMVERPLIRQDETMKLREGMHMAVHPRGGVTLIDNYFIGPDGPGECLHKTPKKIFEL
jgi:Xaa-Pro aminopeptidase